jgi:uncharacterized protein YjiS (DUF1127 family)
MMWDRVSLRAAALIERLFAWGERRRSRSLLAGLDERGLADLARGRAEILEEIGKPCWRP